MILWKFQLFDTCKFGEELFRLLEFPFDRAIGFAPLRHLKSYIRFAC